ncbi:hypothetical protein FN846DRAFT_941901 [Sphaerosporella brunnea]|uniref:F-box domain-containing protein n=1 Tax=Sphaerosporella brunnea TaxID=1250544 RepID=A0A5J5F1Q4_9PEZI|nr:hypothetical protein FN846DRAFT_941901 [Sphaerosporella brunnea]
MRLGELCMVETDTRWPSPPPESDDSLSNFGGRLSMALDASAEVGIDLDMPYSFPSAADSDYLFSPFNSRFGMLDCFSPAEPDSDKNQRLASPAEWYLGIDIPYPFPSSPSSKPDDSPLVNILYLPNEILISISQHLSIPTLNSLTRTSRFFHQLLIPSLYRRQGLDYAAFKHIIFSTNLGALRNFIRWGADLEKGLKEVDLEESIRFVPRRNRRTVEWGRGFQTPLRQAVVLGADLELVKILLHAGARAEGIHLDPPLADTVVGRMLVRRGASVDIPMPRDGRQYTRGAVALKMSDGEMLGDYGVRLDSWG